LSAAMAPQTRSLERACLRNDLLGIEQLLYDALHESSRARNYQEGKVGPTMDEILSEERQLVELAYREIQNFQRRWSELE
jgi:hypothetical protein